MLTASLWFLCVDDQHCTAFHLNRSPLPVFWFGFYSRFPSSFSLLVLLSILRQYWATPMILTFRLDFYLCILKQQRADTQNTNWWRNSVENVEDRRCWLGINKRRFNTAAENTFLILSMFPVCSTAVRPHHSNVYYLDGSFLVTVNLGIKLKTYTNNTQSVNIMICFLFWQIWSTRMRLILEAMNVSSDLPLCQLLRNVIISSVHI